MGDGSEKLIVYNEFFGTVPIDSLRNVKQPAVTFNVTAGRCLLVIEYYKRCSIFLQSAHPFHKCTPKDQTRAIISP